MGMGEAAANDTTVRVALGERSYDVVIGSGLVERAGRLLAERLPGARVVVVTDETVAGLHLARLENAFAQAGVTMAAPAVLPAGEATKSFDRLREVVDHILAARLERADAVVALGGGVIGDLSGFAAGIVRRGMAFVQVPTSLLAQVDSSVGGKTGINSAHGKNLVGVFHQPALVIADTDILDTLDARQFAAGYAEVAKYGLIDRPDFFAWLEENRELVFSGHGEARARAIAESCRAKAEVVAADERESGRRALLNLGHTFGHALEAATGYRSERLVHGEAVSIGMAQAFRFSAHLGLCESVDAERVAAHLSAAGLPISPRAIAGEPLDADMLMAAIAQDKKVSHGRLTFILVRGIGQAFIAKDVDPVAVRDFLRDELSS
ncbi:3-dehydroquinate synthase [Consotaella salsifontis]|nr:3-dehydroquinate synthase [Consotaella salsifontis]